MSVSKSMASRVWQANVCNRPSWCLTSIQRVIGLEPNIHVARHMDHGCCFFWTEQINIIIMYLTLAFEGIYILIQIICINHIYIYGHSNYVSARFSETNMCWTQQKMQSYLSDGKYTMHKYISYIIYVYLIFDQSSTNSKKTCVSCKCM